MEKINLGVWLDPNSLLWPLLKLWAPRCYHSLKWSTPGPCHCSLHFFSCIFNCTRRGYGLCGHSSELAASRPRNTITWDWDIAYLTLIDLACNNAVCSFLSFLSRRDEKLLLEAQDLGYSRNWCSQVECIALLVAVVIERSFFAKSPQVLQCFRLL